VHFILSLNWVIMKGTFFSKSLEWSLHTDNETWQQGEEIRGVLKLKNHGTGPLHLSSAGVGLALGEIKKIHARHLEALKEEQRHNFSQTQIGLAEELLLEFTFLLPPNCSITDKKSSYFLTYGPKGEENHLMLNIGPRLLFSKIVGLFDTFYRFKIKEIKSGKKGVEYKLLPPSSRELAHLETLNLTLIQEGEVLEMLYEFQVRKIDTTSPTTKLNKQTSKITQKLQPKEYLLGKEIMNQDGLLKSIEATLAQIKIQTF
jgi:hypothetical protein